MAHVLIGEIVTRLYIAQDRKALRFDLHRPNPDGTTRSIIARADGDCCSSTWIESLDDPSAIVGAPILQTESIPMLRQPSRDPDDYDVVQFYGFKITTPRGICVIDYRNSSNGYYGGSLEWPPTDPDDYSYFYGGVYGQNVSDMDWKLLASAIPTTITERR